MVSSARLAPEAVGDHVDQRGGKEHPEQHQHGRDQHQDGEDGGGGAGGLFVALLGVQPRIHRNERCGENAFAEEVLQHVRDAEGGLECVGSHGVAEVVGEDALAHQADDFRQQDAGGDGQGGGAAVGLLRFGQIGQVGRYLVRGWRRGFGHACSGVRSSLSSIAAMPGVCSKERAATMRDCGASRVLWLTMRTS